MNVQNEVNKSFAVDYRIIEPSKDFNPDEISPKYKADTLLKAQGQAVKMVGDFSTEESCFIFSLIYDTATELVYSTKETPGNPSKDFLIFDHNSSLAIRPENIATHLHSKILGLQDKYWNNSIIREIENSYSLQLNHISKNSKTEEDFIEAVFDNIKPAEKLTLEGEIPSLRLLLALDIARLYGSKVYYKFQSKKELLVLKF